MRYATMEKKVNMLEQAFADSAGAYYNINLTKDVVPGEMYQVIDGKSYSINQETGLPVNCPFTEVVAYWGKKVNPEERQAYFAFFSLEHLLACYARGEFHVFHRYWTKTALFTPMLAEQHICMYEEAEIGDVLAISYVLDLTQKYREESYQRQLEKKQQSLRRSLSKIREEKQLLDALSIDYTSVYICDLDTDLLIPVKQSPGSNSKVLNWELGEDKCFFSKRFSYYYEHFIVKDSAPDFLEKMNPAYLREYLSQHPRFNYRYKSMPNADGWENFEIQIVRLDHADGFKVVVGYRYIDDVMDEEEKQKKRLQAANDRLEDQIHIISGLTNAYIAVYWVDLRSNICKPVKNIDFFRQAVKLCKSTDDVARAFVTLCVASEDQEKMFRFTDWRKLPERLADGDSVVEEFHGMISPWEWCRASWIVASRDEKGQATEVLYAVEDVTSHVLEIKKREEEKAKEERLSRMRVQTMAEAIHGGFRRNRNDGVGTFVMASEQLAAMLGFDSPEEMIRLFPTLMSMMHPDDAVSEAAEGMRNFQVGKLYTAHYRMQCKDGSWKNVEDRGRLILDEEGKGEFWSFITDQDELTKTTEALTEANRANEALLQARQELELARDEATAANKAKTTFLFNMSHDIRTPMNAIVGYTGLLKKHLDDRTRCEDYIGKIQTSSEYLLALINNVLEMARIESGKVMLDESPEKTGRIMNALVAVYMEEMQKKKIQFISSIDSQTPYIYCDVLKVEEIFFNLLSNAYKYTPEGGTITMRVKELPCDRPGYICMRTTISDTGIGMSETYLPILFDEFSRERNSMGNRIEGTGLGMSIVKKLVDLMKGTIAVESSIGKGTTFTVTLFHRIAAEKDLRQEYETRADITQFAGKRILLAEDNDLNAEIAMELLKEQGFLVERVKDGVECVNALQKAEPGYFELILMDVQMPNLDGYQATRKIRACKDIEKRDIPIIAMTANAFEEDRKNALASGMNDHLAKPIDVGELVKKLAGILEAAKQV